MWWMDPAEFTEHFRETPRGSQVTWAFYLIWMSQAYTTSLTCYTQFPPNLPKVPVFPNLPHLSEWKEISSIRVSSQKGVGDPLNPLMPSAPTSAGSLVCISQMDIFNSFNFLYFHCQPSPVSHVTNPAITSQLNYCNQFFWPASNSFFMY